MSEPFVNPPLYSLIAITTFMAVVFGILFKDMLEYQVAIWQLNRQNQPQINYQHPGIIFTYLGLSFWVGVFLTAGLTVFGFTLEFAAIVAGIMVLALAGLIWWQMGVQLQLLVQGGSAALDLDFDPGAKVVYPQGDGRDPSDAL